MRPVARGPWPTENDGAQKSFASDYKLAKADLLKRLGEFCSYCERRGDLCTGAPNHPFISHRTTEEQSIEDIAESIMGVDVPQRSDRFQKMTDAAVEYLTALEATDRSPSKMGRLKRQLDRLEEPFADNPAYVAFLRMKRDAVGLLDTKSDGKSQGPKAARRSKS